MRLKYLFVALLGLSCANAFAKDYKNEFKKMVYDTNEEMDVVVGKLDDNSFIQQEYKDLYAFKRSVKDVIKKMKL